LSLVNEIEIYIHSG